MQGVANRDLKLENLLVVKREGEGARPLLKICDFGFSKVRFGSTAVLLALPTSCTATCHSARRRGWARCLRPSTLGSVKGSLAASHPCLHCCVLQLPMTECAAPDCMLCGGLPAAQLLLAMHDRAFSFPQTWAPG